MALFIGSCIHLIPCRLALGGSIRKSPPMLKGKAMNPNGEPRQWLRMRGSPPHVANMMHKDTRNNARKILYPLMQDATAECATVVF